MALCFTVLAGKWEEFDGESTENIKFCDSADTMEGAVKIIQDNQLYTYPICRIEVSGFGEEVAVPYFFVTVDLNKSATVTAL